MSKNNNLGDFLKDLANTIREKKGSTELINPQNFSDEIRNLQNESGAVGKYIAINNDNAVLIDILSQVYSYMGGYDIFGAQLKMEVEGQVVSLPLAMLLQMSTYSGFNSIEHTKCIYISPKVYIPDLVGNVGTFYCDSVEALQHMSDGMGNDFDVTEYITPYEITEEEFLDGLIYGMPELGSGF